MSASVFKRKKLQSTEITISKHKYCIDRSQAEQENFMASKLVEKQAGWKILNKPNLFISPMNKFRQRWDYFIIILVLYNCFILPVEIAFEPEVLLTDFMQGISIFTDVVFLIDILLIFRTTISHDGMQVTDAKLIAINYLKGRFAIDVLSTIPFDLIISLFVKAQSVTNKFKLLALLKLIRMTRLSYVIDIMNVALETKIRLKLFKLVFFMAAYVHCWACMWFYVVKAEMLWIPASQLVEFREDTSFHYQTVFEQYLFCLYTSLLLLMGNDLLPQSTPEVVLTTLSCLAGLVIQANLFSELAEIVSEMTSNTTSLQHKIDVSNAAIMNFELGEDIGNQTLTFIRGTHNIEKNIREMHQFMMSLSPNLSNTVTQFIVLNLIKKSNMFGDIDSNKEVFLQVYAFAQLLHVQEYPADFTIFEQGDKSDGLYLVENGLFSGQLLHKRKKVKLQLKYKRGDWFGEVSYYLHTRRTATIKTVTIVSVLYLSKEYKKLFQSNCPIIYSQLKRKIHSYSDEHLIARKTLLKKSAEYLAKIDDSCLTELAFQMQQSYHLKESIIHQKWKHAEGIHMVLQGKLSLVLPAPQRSFIVEQLGVGSSICSLCMLRDEGYRYHHFKVMAFTDVTLLLLPHKILYRTSFKNASLEREMAKTKSWLKWTGVPECDFRKPLKEKNFFLMEAKDLTKNQQLLIRAVKRYIVINKYQRASGLLSSFSRIMQSEKTEAERIEKENMFAGFILSGKLIERLNQKKVLDNFEGLSVVLSHNIKQIDQTWKGTGNQFVQYWNDQHERRQYLLDFFNESRSKEGLYGEIRRI